MERSREEADLADWYGNSWAKSQKGLFVAVWLVSLGGALLSCCRTFGLVGWMSLCRDMSRAGTGWCHCHQVCRYRFYGWYVLSL